MKFAREFQERLLKDGFPAHWIDSAISYGQLKKCIKRVQRELAAIGLDVQTLQHLLQSVERQSRVETGNDQGSQVTPGDNKPFQYLLSASRTTASPVRPKLLFVVDAETGEPLDAKLSPETKNLFHQLAIAERLTDVRITDEEVAFITRAPTINFNNGSEPEATAENPFSEDRRDSQGRLRKLVEVPLTSDSEFFRVLEKELFGLAALQDKEQRKLTQDIESVGQQLSRTTNPEDSKSRMDLNHWRRLFELYLESNIFFANYELDHGAHDGAKAEAQWNSFLSQAKKAGLLERFKKPANAVALQKFLTINLELLQCLKFQEINQRAMSKILKKFDKRTALGARVVFPSHLQGALVTRSFSKALASEVSNNILSVVPQLDDYLCPICFQLAYRPIRLRCQHVFCIRCLIVMQREGQKNCALCREPTIVEADSRNLDKALQNFLTRYFSEEVKAKQKANEKALYDDHFLPTSTKCSVM